MTAIGPTRDLVVVGQVVRMRGDRLDRQGRSGESSVADAVLVQVFVITVVAGDVRAGAAHVETDDVLEAGLPAEAEEAKHIDRCLSCLSCMTTCPSGVNYMHLVDHAREYIEQTYKRPFTDRALRWVLARILPYPVRESPLHM